MTGINLIPTTRLRARRLRARLFRWAWGVSGYAVLLGIACSIIRGVSGGGGETLAARLETAKGDNQKLSAALVANARRLSQAQSTQRMVLALSDRPDWSLLLTLLGEKLDDDLVLREMRLQPSDRPDTTAVAAALVAPVEQFRLELRGLGRSQEAVSRFVSRLEGTKLFSEVKLLRRGREPFLAGTAVSFDLACRLGQAKEKS
jgi:Tfp pilus assembly protein PilN